MGQMCASNKWRVLMSECGATMLLGNDEPTLRQVDTKFAPVFVNIHANY